MKFSIIVKKFIPVLFLGLAVLGLVACGESGDRAPGDTIAVRDEQFTVLPLQTMTVVVLMEVGQIMAGYITVTGGDNEITVYVKDDYGEEIVNFGTVTGTQNIGYKVSNSGFYTIYFDNSSSVSDNKEIRLHYSVR